MFTTTNLGSSLTAESNMGLSVNNFMSVNHQNGGRNEIIEQSKENHLDLLPFEIFSKIILLLPNKDICTCNIVCKRWSDLINSENFKKLKFLECDDENLINLVKNGSICYEDVVKYSTTNNSDILKSAYPKSVRQDFSHLVEEEYFSWQEVAKYAQLSFFIDGLIIRRCQNNRRFTKNENPQFVENRNFYADLKSPCFSDGDSQFTIFNLTDIKCRIKGKEQPYILSGEKEKNLTCLAGNDNNLFALRIDGIIVCWDVEKRMAVENINTSFSNNKSYVAQNYQNEKVYRNVYFSSFYANNELLVLKYRVFDLKSKDVIEIIDLKNADKSQVIEIDMKNDRASCMPEKTLIYDNMLYILQRNSIFVYNLHTKKTEEPIIVPMKAISSDERAYLLDMTIRNDVLYVSDFQRTLHLIDLHSREKTKSIDVSSAYLYNLCVVDNRLFSSDWNNIETVNIDTGSTNPICPFPDTYRQQGEYEKEKLERSLIQTLIEKVENRQLKAKGAPVEEAPVEEAPVAGPSCIVS